jgi:hypothetical protein
MFLDGVQYFVASLFASWTESQAEASICDQENRPTDLQVSLACLALKYIFATIVWYKGLLLVEHWFVDLHHS